ncbi:MAG: rRNA maturation RNase YbeY [Termitinemataceae bacterium]
MNNVDIMVEEIHFPWTEKMEAFCYKVLDFLKKDNWDLSILLCDNPTIQRLNFEYRQKDEPTDVLSFELGETSTDEAGTERYIAGDIIISIPMVSENAAYFHVSEDEELRRLLIHGILHLNGMDHATNEAEEPMLIYQEQILTSLCEEHIIS